MSGDLTFLDLVLEPLQYEFVVRALATTVIASILCAVLSCWLVLVGWSLMGDAVSHAVLPGVVLAYVIGIPFAIGALVFGVIAVVAIGAISTTSRVKEDAAIGIVFSTLFALGLVLISVTPSQTDLNHIIFGNILGVSTTDLIQIGGLAAIGLVLLFMKRRDLTLYAFDPIHCHALGISTRRLQALLLGMLALTAVVSLQVVGVILVVAMLIIPGATAYLLTDRFSRMLLIAPAISATCAVVGIYVSYWIDAASGGLVVVTQGVFFFLVYLLSPRHGLVVKLTSSTRRIGTSPVIAEGSEWVVAPGEASATSLAESATQHQEGWGDTRPV
ncbi:metal ABC transporter permease [Nocardioides panzhihuensis]|uniref:Manganese transport system permease protein n=1 Tax=Nocardioides panzhihuensis TaxID=860243 RepID=A0A7Z0IRD8_9ACTN|nr:manganese transport system permease protein [Nocardioides panzhihuensis]